MNPNSQSNLFLYLGSSQGVFSLSSTGQQQSGQSQSPFGLNQGQSIFKNAQNQGQTQSQGQATGFFGNIGQSQGQGQGQSQSGNIFQNQGQNQGQSQNPSSGQNVFGNIPQSNQSAFPSFGNSIPNKT